MKLIKNVSTGWNKTLSVYFMSAQTTSDYVSLGFAKYSTHFQNQIFDVQALRGFTVKLSLR